MKNTQFITSLIVLMLFLAACSTKQDGYECQDPIGCVTIMPNMPLKIGVLQAFSGALKSNGIDQLRGIQMALSERGGKVMGHPVHLQAEDSHCSGEGGTTAALKITADPQSVAILGTYCSGAAVKAAKIATDAGLVIISATNTSPALTSIAEKAGANHYDGYFRTAHNDLALGKAVADFARNELGLSRAATINDGDSYTKGLTEAFGSAFVKMGGKIHWKLLSTKRT
jgi:branched-chain amino acid transport system substrate-binding protein